LPTWLSRYRFVKRGIESLANGINDLESRVAERFQQFLLNHVDTLHDRAGIGRRRVHVRESRNVVERLNEMSNQIGLRSCSRVLALLLRALAIVVVLGSKSQILVALGRFIRSRPDGIGRSRFGRARRRSRFIRDTGGCAELRIAALAIALTLGATGRVIVRRAHCILIGQRRVLALLFECLMSLS